MATLPTQVRAGDVISANLVNQILGEIADLQLQVATLSGGAMTLGPPEIIRLSKESISMGEELQVFGRNLDVASLVSVEIANVPVPSFKLNSSSSLLIFDVPAIIGITDPGAMVTLEIRNTQGGPARASLFVKPGQSNQLNASFGFSVTAPTAPIPPSGTGIYTFSIDALTSSAETYIVNPTIDAGWTALASPAELTIPKSQPSPTNRTVSVSVTAPASGAATLRLELIPRNFPGKSYPSQNVPVAVNSNSGGTNPDFEPIATDVFPGISYVGGKIHCAATRQVSITQTVRLAVRGTYLVTAEIVPASAPWTRTIDNNPNPLTTLVADKQEDAMVTITGASSIPAGSAAKLRITMARQAPTTDSASFEFDIVP